MAASNSVLPDHNHKRWLALSSAGAFVILAGFMAPRLVTLPTIDKPVTPTPAASTERAVVQQDSASPVPAPATESLATNPDFTGTLGNVIIGTVVAVAAFIGLKWYQRRRSLARSGEATPGLMSVLAAVPLPYHCCVFLVEIGDRLLLTGIDSNGIKTVIALPEPASVHD